MVIYRMEHVDLCDNSAFLLLERLSHGKDDSYLI